VKDARRRFFLYNSWNAVSNTLFLCGALSATRIMTHNMPLIFTPSRREEEEVEEEEDEEEEEESPLDRLT
jgi:hypothetical protein